LHGYLAPDSYWHDLSDANKLRGYGSVAIELIQSLKEHITSPDIDGWAKRIKVAAYNARQAALRAGVRCTIPVAVAVGAYTTIPWLPLPLIVQALTARHTIRPRHVMRVVAVLPPALTAARRDPAHYVACVVDALVPEQRDRPRVAAKAGELVREALSGDLQGASPACAAVGAVYYLCMQEGRQDSMRAVLEHVRRHTGMRLAAKGVRRALDHYARTDGL